MDSEPPTELFTTWELARDALQTWARDHCFAVATVRTRKNASEVIRKVWLQCTKRGEFNPSGSGKRQTASRKEKCTWEAILTRLQGTASWQIAGELVL